MARPVVPERSPSALPFYRQKGFESVGDYYKSLGFRDVTRPGRAMIAGLIRAALQRGEEGVEAERRAKQ